MKKTKIIATISSFNCEPPFLAEMHKAGMDVVRMNTAHQTTEESVAVIANIRAVSDRIAILVDTKGPEIRTTPADEDIPVKTGDTITIKGAKEQNTTKECICVTYDGIANDVDVGKRILIDDGDISFLVKDKKDGCLVCEVENDGTIKGKKSINVPSVSIKLPALTQKDMDFIRFAAANDLDFIAHSFVRNKEDVIAVQEILDETKSQIKIIAKIENQEGVDNIDEILDYAYGVMVARGDLAIEIPTEKIPLIQKSLVQKCIQRRRPVIVATQMLQSMIESPRPTRAEVSDVGNACFDGTDAVMLSGETAYGKYPLESVEIMRKIALEIENGHETFIDSPYETENNVTSYLSKAAVKASMRLNTKGLIADSISGQTIRSLAAYRGKNPIFAQCYSKSVVRMLSLSYGVVATYMEEDLSSHEFLSRALGTLVDEYMFDEEDLLTVLAGNFGAAFGASYIEISTVANMMQKK